MASFLLLVASVVASPVYATTPNLSGFWVNSANTRSGYTLRESTDQSVLNASWAGLPPHQTLVGHFKGTLDMSGDAYIGTFNVTEQGPPGSPPVSASGSGTFALSSSFFASFPSIDVTLNADNGQTSNFTLEIFSALPLLRPEGVTEEITNPSPNLGSGTLNLVPMGSQLSVHSGVGARPAAGKKKAILGETRFSIPPHQGRRVSVSLNKRGRRLLKQRGSLTVHVVVHMKASSGLPTFTKAGVVTFRK